jgi:hypothetical protein
MPQVVKTQPTGAFTQGGAGIGAVIFDRPQYDPQTMALKVQGDLENWAKEKQAEAAKKKAETDKLIADLNFDDKGAFPDDVDYFKEGKNKLIDAQAKLDATDPNSPEWNKNYREAQRVRDWYKSDVTSSSGQWGEFKKIKEQFDADPNKYDKDKFDQWVASVRVTRDPQKRSELFKINPLQAPKEELEDLTIEMIKKGKDAGVISPTNVKRSYGKTPTGEDIMIEQTELFPEEKRVSIAADWISNNGKIKDAVLEKFSAAPQSDIDYYTQKASQLSQKYGKNFKPYDIWYSDSIEKYDTQGEKSTQLGYSPERQQEAQYKWGEGKKLQNQGAGLLEAVSGAFQGKPQYLQPIKTYAGYDAVGIKGLSGYNIGTYTYSDKDGVKDVPNKILEVVRTKDGRLMVMTSKSLYDEQIRTAENNTLNTDPKKMETARLYIPYDNVTQLFNDIATGHFGKDGGEQIKVGAKEYATKFGGYNDATAFDAAKVVPLSKEEQEKRDEIYGMKVKRVVVEGGEAFPPNKTKQQQPKAETKAAKVDYSKYPQSSDGKWYYDGTQWLPIK